MRQQVEAVLADPTYALPGSDPGHVVLIRRNGRDKLVAVRFDLRHRGRDYWVRSAYTLSEGKLESIFDAIRKQGGTPELLAVVRLPGTLNQAEPLLPHNNSPADRLIKIARGEWPGQSPSDTKYSLFARAATAASNTCAAKAVGWTERLGQTLSPLGALPRKNRYLARRYLALGEVAEAEDLGRKVYDTFKRAGDAEKRALYDYLTTAGAAASTVPEALRNEAVRVKAMIERGGQALVQRGLLTQASFDKYRGEYLPRLYLKYMLPEGFIRAAAGGRKVSDLGYLLKRGDIPEDIRRLVLDEIKDPGYLAAKALSTPMRDMAILGFLNDIARDKQWMFEDSIVEWEGEPAVIPFTHRMMHWSRIGAVLIAARISSHKHSFLEEAG